MRLCTICHMMYVQVCHIVNATTGSGATGRMTILVVRVAAENKLHADKLRRRGQRTVTSRRATRSVSVPAQRPRPYAVELSSASIRSEPSSTRIRSEPSSASIRSEPGEHTQCEPSSTRIRSEPGEHILRSSRWIVEDGRPVELVVCAGRAGDRARRHRPHYSTLTEDEDEEQEEEEGDRQAGSAKRKGRRIER